MVVKKFDKQQKKMSFMTINRFPENVGVLPPPLSTLISSAVYIVKYLNII